MQQTKPNDYLTIYDMQRVGSSHLQFSSHSLLLLIIAGILGAALSHTTNTRVTIIINYFQHLARQRERVSINLHFAFI
jgi:hypothetical protein